MKKIIINVIFLVLAIALLIFNYPIGNEIAFILIGIFITSIYDFLIEYAGSIRMLFKILKNWNKPVRISFAY